MSAGEGRSNARSAGRAQHGGRVTERAHPSRTDRSGDRSAFAARARGRGVRGEEMGVGAGQVFVGLYTRRSTLNPEKRRMKTLRMLLAVALTLALAPAAALAQGGTIRGTVTEQGSGQALQGVQISVVGTNQTVVTNQEGRFA